MLSRLKLLVAVVLLAGTFTLVEPARIWAVGVRLDPMTGAAVAVLGALGIGVQFIKWRLMLRWRAPGTNQRQCLESLFVGFGLGCLTPGRLGELGRGIFLPGRTLEWGALSAIDRIGSTAVTTFAAVAGLVILLPPATAVALVTFSGLLLSTILLSTGRMSALTDRWEPTRAVATIVAQIPGRMWLQSLSLSVAFNLVFFSQFWLLLNAFGEIAPSTIWAIPAVFAVKALLPISLLDVGVREIAAMLVLAPLRVDPEIAFAAAFTLFLVNVLAPGLAGVVVILRRLKPAQIGVGGNLRFREA